MVLIAMPRTLRLFASFVRGHVEARSLLIVLGPCLALGRSSAEKGQSYLTHKKIMSEDTPFWNIIIEAGSGMKAPSCCIVSSLRRCDKTRFLITSCCNHFLLPPTVAGDKCTVEVFKQFLHWVAMQKISERDERHGGDMGKWLQSDPRAYY